MKKVLGLVLLAGSITGSTLVGCAPSGSTSNAATVPAEERAKVAEDQVGIDASTTHWKCVGQLDADHFVSVALQYDFTKGFMLSVNKTDFTGGVSTTGVLIQHVSSYVQKHDHKIAVALPVTNERYPEGTPLITYNDKDQTVTFGQDLTGDRLVTISCPDQKTTVQQ